MSARATAPAATSNYPVIRDRKAIDAAREYYEKKQQLSILEGRLDELKPIIIEAMGEAPTAFMGDRIVSCTDVPPLPASPNVTITKAMVGQVIPGTKGRRGYRKLEVK